MAGPILGVEPAQGMLPAAAESGGACGGVSAREHELRGCGTRVRWFPGVPPAPPDMDERSTTHKLLALGHWNDDLQVEMGGRGLRGGERGEGWGWLRLLLDHEGLAHAAWRMDMEA
eukprot:364951-Chlamydomonas_euryale.AAC.3